MSVTSTDVEMVTCTESSLVERPNFKILQPKNCAEIIEESTRRIEGLAELLGNGYFITEAHEYPALTGRQIKELELMISRSAQNIRSAYTKATVDFGTMYVALVGHRCYWSKDVTEFVNRVGLETPMDWSLHS